MLLVADIFAAVHPFINLFGGIADSEAIGAYGTGTGRWVKQPLTPLDVADHLVGTASGIGIPPLRPDNTVVFAAIDLDEPDFDAAREMQKYIPGTSFIERSRSGNAHVWVFFAEPIEAWLPMALLKEACVAAGKKHVEVFPKNHDFAKVKLGNYINLPYHGGERPIIASSWEDTSEWDPTGVELECEWPLDVFIADATRTRNDPEDWRKRARWLMLAPPEARASTSTFGGRQQLHECCDYIINRAVSGEYPITEGSRSIVYFSLSKMLLNWSAIDEDDAWETIREANAASPTPLDSRELRRVFDNAARGGFTSTGCDDPVMAEYVHPDCPIVARSN
jgi:hypothetical protein